MNKPFTITTSKTVSLHLTPEQWGLASDEILRDVNPQLPRAAVVADALNRTVADAFNTNADSPARALEHAHDALAVYRANGSHGEVATRAVNSIARAVFGRRAEVIRFKRG